MMAMGPGRRARPPFLTGDPVVDGNIREAEAEWRRIERGDDELEGPVAEWHGDRVVVWNATPAEADEWADAHGMRVVESCADADRLGWTLVAR